MLLSAYDYSSRFLLLGIEESLRNLFYHWLVSYSFKCARHFWCVRHSPIDNRMILVARFFGFIIPLLKIYRGCHRQPLFTFQLLVCDTCLI